MRILIDLQFCQHPAIASDQRGDALALVHEIVRQQAAGTCWIALDARFPSGLADLRAAFSDVLQPERIVVYATPARDGAARTDKLIALVYENFFDALDPDLVFTPGVGNHADAMGSGPWGGGQQLRAWGISSLGGLGNAALRASLDNADLLLACGPGVAGQLPTSVDLDCAVEEAATNACAAFARLAASRGSCAASALRPRLAWVTPAPPQSGRDDATIRLLGQLAQHYDIELVVADSGLESVTGLMLRNMSWFQEHGAEFTRVLYHISGLPPCGALFGLLEEFPGIVVLHDFSLGGVLDQIERSGMAPHAFTRALYASHGYSGLSEYRRNGREAAVLKFPANKMVLDRALGIIVGSASMRTLARQWYGPHAGADWRVVDLSDNANALQAGQLYCEAIEAFSCRSAPVRYRQLVRNIALADAPNDPRDPLLLAAARAIGSNQPPKGARQLLVDISALAATDLKTGIQRVVRSILLALINNPPAGFRIEPVYGNGGNRRYRYARRFTLNLIGQSAVQAEDEAIEHQAGDIFLGLDLAANSTVGSLDLLAEMRGRGIATYFVVYDVLPLLQPHDFPYGTAHYFGEYIQAIARHADGLVCISRAVADELSDWISLHVAARPRPLQLGHFHLGADLDASAPSRGMPENGQHVLASMRARSSIVMVGTIEPRKCHAQALAAFDLLWERGVNVNLVIVGKQGWLVDALASRLLAHPLRGENLFWLPGVSDEMLTEVYRLAAALLAASTGEGFGLPLIEAAQHGVPIIARALPVFREVSGDHAYYFDGNEPVQLADAVQAWLHLFQLGQAPASTDMPWLTWSDSAQQLVATIVDGQWDRTLQI